MLKALVGVRNSMNFSFFRLAWSKQGRRRRSRRSGRRPCQLEVVAHVDEVLGHGAGGRRAWLPSCSRTSIEGN